MPPEGNEAYFQFGTNAGAVANEITQAMNRALAAVREGQAGFARLGTPAASALGGFEQQVAALQTRMQGQLELINRRQTAAASAPGAYQRPAEGTIRAEYQKAHQNFQRQYVELVRTEMGKLPPGMQGDFRRVAAQGARGIADQVNAVYNTATTALSGVAAQSGRGRTVPIARQVPVSARLQGAEVGSLRTADEELRRLVDQAGHTRRSIDEARRATSGARTQVVDNAREFAGMPTGGAGGAGGGRGGLLGLLGGGDSDGTFSMENVLGAGARYARYAVVAAAFFAIMGAISDTRQEAERFAESLTDLEVAMDTGSPVRQTFVDDLGQIARVAGENVSAAMDTASRYIRAFNQDTDGSQKQLEAVGQQGAEASQMLAVIADKTLADVTGDLVAITTSFGLGADELDQAVEAITAAKVLGGEPGDVSQGLASGAIGLKEAGFELAESANLISVVEARLDGTGRDIATRLNRAFQILRSGNARAVMQGMGVDTTGTVQSQVAQLAELRDAGEIPDTAIRSLVGAPNAREFTALLDNYTLAVDRNRQATADGGKAQDEYQRKLDNLRGTFTQIAGAWAGIQTGLVQSGFLAPIGLLIETVEPLLKTLMDLLRAWNALPAPIRTSVAVMLELAGVIRLLGGASRIRAASMGGEAVANSLVARAAAIRAAAEVRLQAIMGRGVALERTAAASTAADTVATEANTVAKIANAEAQSLAQAANLTEGAWGPAMAGQAAGMGAMRAGAGSMLGFLLNPWVLLTAGVIGLAVGFQQITAQIEETAKATRMAERAERALQEARTPEELRTASRRATGAADLVRKSGSGFWGTAGELWEGLFRVFRLGGPREYTIGNEQQASELEASAEIARRRADALDAARRDAALLGSGGVFGPDLNDIEALEAGLEQLTAAGGTAATQLDALIERVSGLGGAAQEGVILPGGGAAVAQDLASGARGVYEDAYQELLRGRGQVGEDDLAGVTKVFLDNWLSQTANPEKFAQLQQDIAKTAEGYFNEVGVAQGGQLDEAQQQELARRIANLYVPPKGQKPETVEKMRELIARFALEDIDTLLTFKPEDLDPMASAFLQRQMVSRAQDASRRVAIEGGSKVEQARAALDVVKAARDLAVTTGTPITAEVEQALLESQRAMGNALRARGRAYREMQIALLPEEDVAGRTALEAQNLASELADAIAAGDEEAEFRVRGQQATLERRRAREERGRAAAVMQAYIDPRASRALVEQQLAAAEEELAATQELDSQGNTTREWAQRYGEVQQLRLSLSRANADAAVAARAATTDPRDEVANARNALQDALGALALELPGTAEYDRAQRTVAERRLEAMRSEVARTNAAARLSVDPASQVGNAAVDLEASRRQLATLLPGTREYYEALRRIGEQQIALADAHAEAAHVRRMLSADITDPMTDAREQLRMARGRLQRAIARGADPDVVDKARLDEREAQANAEQTAFSRRFDRMQTADELGRISHQRYLRYLNNEHDRLSSIADRTYQQQQQLDQIDQALQAAASEMSGQWNIGEIDIPTIYEVRRSIAARARGMDYQRGPGTPVRSYMTQSMVDNRQANIHLHGADTNQVVQRVLRAVDDALGTSAAARGTRGRKVY